MILSAQSIRQRVSLAEDAVVSILGQEHQELLIRPFVERGVIHGMSYGLSAAGYDVCIKDPYEIVPGGFLLATTIEYFEFPNDLRGMLHDKSSWARKGLAVQNTIFEPGWRGWPTIEISNHGLDTIDIHAGCPIGQMSFQLLDVPTDQPYQGKYQDQPHRPVEAREE